jgi:hypothetical protein
MWVHMLMTIFMAQPPFLSGKQCFETGLKEDQGEIPKALFPY